MTCVLVGFSRSLLALIHSLTSWMQTAKLWTAVRTSLTDTLINLAVVGILVDVQTMTPDQLPKLRSVQKVQKRPMPNVMAALPSIGGASVQRRKLWLKPTTRLPCSNAAKSLNPLKFAGVPQTTEPISALSGRTFAIL